MPPTGLREKKTFECKQCLTWSGTPKTFETLLDAEQHVLDVHANRFMAMYHVLVGEHALGNNGTIREIRSKAVENAMLKREE